MKKNGNASKSKSKNLCLQGNKVLFIATTNPSRQEFRSQPRVSKAFISAIRPNVALEMHCFS